MAAERESTVAPRLGGKTAVVTFVAVIFAFVGETQLTQVISSSSATLNQSITDLSN
jgi:hypothetical protein